MTQSGNGYHGTVKTSGIQSNPNLLKMNQDTFSFKNTGKQTFTYDDADGTVTDMNAKQQNGYLVFETTHFSYYAVAELSAKSTQGSDGSSSNDSSSSDSSSETISNPDTGSKHT